VEREKNRPSICTLDLLDSGYPAGMRRLGYLGLLLLAAAGCSKEKATSSSTTCVPLAAVAPECPPDWNAALTARDAFCARNDPFFDTFFSSAPCHDGLHYTRYLFDGGPRYCVYDPATLKLTGYGAFDGKAMFQQFSCGTERAAFDDQGCAGEGCPVPPDAASGDADAAPADAQAHPEVPPALLDAAREADGSAPTVEVRCDLVDQDCPTASDSCIFTCENARLVTSCFPAQANPGKLGEPCGSEDGGPSRLCDRGLGCFASRDRPTQCYRYCRAGDACPAGTTCDTTTELRYACPGNIPAGICR
jgi:hypothetical protein